jgi:hypothetical protein
MGIHGQICRGILSEGEAETQALHRLDHDKGKILAKGI